MFMGFRQESLDPFSDPVASVTR